MDVVKWVDSTVRRRAAKEDQPDDGRRARLVTAAIEAIEELGPTVGMSQIAERAGMPRPNVYRHFASKDQLDAEVIRYITAELHRLTRPGLTTSGPPYDVIRASLAPSVLWAAAHPNLYRFVAPKRQTPGQGRGRILGEIVEAMAGWLPDGAELPVPPDGVIAGLMGMVDASLIWWLDHEDESRDELIDRLARQIEVVLADLLERQGFVVPAHLGTEPAAR